MEWYQIKTALSQATGISQDAFHILVAVGIQLLVAWALRRDISAFAPWLVVLGMELANEYSDLAFETWPDRTWQIGESVKDIVVTMVVPTVLLVLARWRPALFAAASKPPPEEVRPAE